MKDEFDMTDLGKMKYFLGVEVLQTSEGIYLSQKKYACKLHEKFGLQNANSMKNPIVPDFKLLKEGETTRIDATIYKQLIGSLMYITATRPDLMYVVCLLSSLTIKLSKNPVMHGRSRHIDVRFHFLRDLTKEEVVKLVHCGTNDQVADILTKPLKLEVFLKLREKLGVCEVPNLN
ncbi:Retrovirus-related Pol polyprotein from transposon RE1 [Vitis vinifera]|uniref:Retrovirus-related Pol polyprotein from transposon RE1 n=1 Tax=Vitis vinifera TaxID=29760 RepID=A0A438FST5_VITVI|nr:Retrovirus-related Pol polyprotein from transposon RE1 [Vitis vinifera]